MKHRIAKSFSDNIEYKIFKNNYCLNNCVHHKERANGFVEFTEKGGCPIEDRIESVRYSGITTGFPNILLEVWGDDICTNWHHCPFYRAGINDKQESN